MSSSAASRARAVEASLRAHAERLLRGRPHAASELATKLAAVCERRRGSARAPTAALYAGARCAERAQAVVRSLPLDDAAYARWHVAQRGVGSRRPRAAGAIAAELAVRGVPRAAAAAALAAADDGAAAAAAARAGRRAQARAADGGLAALRRRGFSYATARAALDADAEEAAEEARALDAAAPRLA